MRYEGNILERRRLGQDPEDSAGPQRPQVSAATLAERRAAILREVQAIPALPPMVHRTLALIQDEETPMRSLATAIESDPGLASNVLRIANSAYFAGPRSIGSVQEALVRLGLKRVSELVMTCAAAPIAKKPVRGYDLAPGQLLAHAVAVAVGTEALAAALGRNGASHLFTAGLLHDLGKMILGTFLDVDARAVMNVAFEDRVSFEAAEKQVLGINHAEAGAALLEAWNLPNELVAAARLHHDPDAANRPSRTVDYVHVADQLALEIGIGAGTDGSNYHPSAAAAARIGLTQSAMQHVMCRIQEGVAALDQFIGLAGGQ